MGAIAKKFEYVKSENDNLIQLVRPVEPKKETNKKRGKKSEVYPYEIEDVKRVLNYFKERNSWSHYLLLTFGCNMARRIGDTLSLKWVNIYNPDTGKIRSDILEIREDKTDKLANPKINQAVREAIELYLDKTGCNPSENNYDEYVFKQLTGTYKGSVLSESGHLKALKRAAKDLNIEYNIGTHSARKFFGMMNRMLHPGDYDSMEILQTIYNHSDSKTTKHYIGLTKKKVDKYYDDMGNFYNDYIVGNKQFKQTAEKPIVSLDINDLRDIIKSTYEFGKNNAGNPDAMVHIDSINLIMNMVESLAK